MPKSFFGIYQKKDILLPKTKRKPQWDNRRGTFAIISNPIPTGQAIHELKNTYFTEFLPQEGEFQAPRQAPEPGVWNQEEVPQSIWLSRPEGLECKSSIGLKKAETPLLEGAHKVSGALGPKAKQWLHRSPEQTYWWVLEGLQRRQELAVAHQQGRQGVARTLVAEAPRNSH